MAIADRVGVTLRAVVQRINRKLAQKGEQLRSHRGRYSCGYFVVNVRSGEFVKEDVDPETVARELGVLHGWETVAREG